MHEALVVGYLVVCAVLRVDRVVATLLEAAGVESERAQVRAKAMMWAFRGAGDAEMGERIGVLGDLFEDSIPG
jgi:hypothetical protein